VTGAAEYVDDMPHPPGLLHAALVMSPVPRAVLKSVDIQPALDLNNGGSLDGDIVDVLLASDVQGSNVIGAVIKDEEIFASLKAPSLKTVGQIIGVCIATTQAAAKEGARAVKLEYEELEAVLTIEDAVKCNSFYEDLGPPAITTNHYIYSGEPQEAEEGDVVVEGEMKVGGQEHFYLEPNVTMVVPVDGGEELVVYSSTQNPAKTQNFVASATGIAANKVVCRMKRMGGGFGGKETRSVFVALVAAVAARKHNVPVKICLDRDVDMAITGTRHPFLCKYKACASKTGKLKSLEAQLYSNGGCSLDLSGPIMDRALLHIDNVYKWPHLRVKGVVCRTNLPSNTAFRGFGGPQAIVFTETVMDHLATVLSIDPLTLRKNNLYQEGDDTHFGQKLVNWRVGRCIDEVTESSDLAARMRSVEEFNNQNRYRKRGISLVPTKFGIAFTAKFMNQGGALVHIHTDGSVLVTHGGTEMGQGLHTKVCQIAARALGVPLSDVHVADTATDKVANSQPSAASQSTDLYGMATLNACEEIRKRLEPIAKAMTEASGSPPAFKDLVTSAYFQRVDLSAHGFYIVPHDRCGFDFNIDIPQGTHNSARGTPFNYFSQGAAVSEVEVDCLTGDCRVLRTDISMDVGSAINPVIDIGQIEGAFVQGWGWLSMEELIFGDKHHKWVRPGHLFTKGPGTYKIPAADDTPLDFRVSLLKDCENPFAVHSSKAIGEPPFCLATSAFLAAKHACDAARAEQQKGGVTWYPLDAPATSERLRMRCLDGFTQTAVTGGIHDTFFPNSSW
jgi:xanthine dehydrogenase/oxidase